MGRQHVGIHGRYAVTTIDLTRYVGCCILCSWQVQTGYRARSDLGGAEALAEALVWVLHEHMRDEHPDDQNAPVLVDENGDRHHVASGDQGACNMLRLPELWVDR